MELPSVYLRSGESKCAKNNIQISVDSKYHTGPNLQQWKPQGWLSKGQGEITPHLPQRPNRLTLRSVSVELFLSDILTPLPVCNCCCWGFSSWWICYPRGTTTAADGLSAGQQQLCPWARWHWLCQTQLLAPYPTTKTLPLKPKTWAKWHLNLPEIFSSRYSKEHAKFLLPLVPGDNLTPEQWDYRELYVCSSAEPNWWKGRGTKKYSLPSLSSVNDHFPWICWKHVLGESIHRIPTPTTLQHSSTTWIIFNIRRERKSFSQRTLHPQRQFKVIFITLYMLSHSFILFNTTIQYLFKILHAQRLWKELYPLR